MIFFKKEKYRDPLSIIRGKMFVQTKLTFLILTTFLTLGYGKTYPQQINLQLENVRLEQAFDLLEKQINYSIVYEKSSVRESKTLNISIKNKSLEETLKILLKDQGLDYKIHQRFIVISRRSNERSSRQAVTLEKLVIQSNLTGTVRDSLGRPIIGASILNTANKKGVSANSSGEFVLEGNVGDILEISSVGFQTQRYVVNTLGPVQIVLQVHQDQLDAVVVTALGIKRSERALSYHVQEVDGEELTNVRSTHFINALAGKVAGVQINSSASGPGAAVKVVMRGAKSLSKNNNALYVIDGVPMYNTSFNSGTDASLYAAQPGTEGAADINPDDIETISMLTGPSAAALYGYEGANGVVLITTKKGRADRTSVTVSNNTTFSTPLLMPKFQEKYGNITGESGSWGPETTNSYDPAKFFNTGSNLSNGVSLETGNEKSQTYASAAMTNANGILPNNEYRRNNFSFRNTTSFLDKKFVLDIGANYILQKDKNMVAQGQYFNPLPALYLFPRNEDFDEVRLFERYEELTGVNTQYWPYGDQGLSIQNPYWIMHRMNREPSRKRYKLSSSLQYKITDWLNITGRVNIDNSDLRNTERRYAGTLATFAGPKGYFRLDNRRDQQTYADVIATLNKQFDNFTFNINLGGAIKDLNTNSHYVLGNLDKVTNWFTTENISRTNAFKIDDNGRRQQSQSLFANAEIGYKNMLYLTLTGREDWDSALAYSESGVVPFFYPSIGLSGIISDMVAMPQWLTYLQTRFSYTSVGTAYDPYITSERYEYNDQTNQYNTLSLYPNRNLKPELTNSYEAGLNMRFFKNSLRLDATYYKSNTLNQTFIAELPASSGYSGVYVQAGDVQNAGLELALGYEMKVGNFVWDTHATYSFNQNTIKKLAHGIENPVTEETIHMPYINKATLGSGGSPIVRLVEGGSMGDIYVNRDWKRDDNGYVYLDPKTFLPSLIDTDYEKVGSVMPPSYAGWKNMFSYKGVTANVLLRGRFGGVAVSNTQAIMDRYGVSEYSAQLRETEGVTINNEQISAKNYLEIIAAGTGQGAHYVYSATNIRLGEVSVSYTIPKKWVNSIADITVGLVGNNLMMIYNKAPFDPEQVASATNTYYTGVDYFMQPSLRSVGFNVKLQF